jgi:hypothetical protein
MLFTIRSRIIHWVVFSALLGFTSTAIACISNYPVIFIQDTLDAMTKTIYHDVLNINDADSNKLKDIWWVGNFST